MKYERKNYINYKQKCMFPKNDINIASFNDNTHKISIYNLAF